MSHLLKLFAEGADGIQIVGCRSSNCQSDMQVEKRIENTQKVLNENMIGAERLGIFRRDGLSAGELIQIARMRAEAVMSLGPNPIGNWYFQ